MKHLFIVLLKNMIKMDISLSLLLGRIVYQIKKKIPQHRKYLMKIIEEQIILKKI